MADRERSDRGEGNILPQTILLSSSGEVVHKGETAENPLEDDFETWKSMLNMDALEFEEDEIATGERFDEPTTNATQCGAGGGKGRPGFQPNNTCAVGSGRGGRQGKPAPPMKKKEESKGSGSSGDGKTSFSDEQRSNALSKLKSMKEAEEGYRTFGESGTSDDPSQVQLKDLGFAGYDGGAYMYGKKETEKIPSASKVMELDIKDVSYKQSSVTREGVEKKLTGEFAGDGDLLPRIIQTPTGYQIQTGHHRAVAQHLATGKITAIVHRVEPINPKAKKIQFKIVPPKE